MRTSRVGPASLLALAACAHLGRVPPGPPPSPSTSPTGARPAATSFDPSNVTETVRVLAGEIGPRPATTSAYRRAAAYVERRLRSFGYATADQRFHVPGGVSNYAPVQEGDTFNVVASTRGFVATRPHVVVGAHLDTVPQAPGAVDDAAGIGVLLELARLASLAPPRVPIVFVAFAAEEARVPNGGLHGSRHYVSRLTTGERAAIVGAISIDRVGVGDRVPVCTAGSDASKRYAGTLLDAATRARIPAFSCDNATSDHVPFDRAGVPAARIGPDPYTEYHTPRDVPALLRPAQVGRAGTLLWAALR